ncbi:hypothetical protein KVT40_009023 [Elsinoe batatas]|uniref:ADP-ribosylation factor n=1 Tax=Elsinoe batatas TaxID=2601811 RepID=A0A8K0PCY7_9PEZI|nr:hypothetical protein KVT40_009023 [Elsinoe batatas]
MSPVDSTIIYDILPWDQPRRIFLSGSEGSGKSSILQHIATGSPYKVATQYTFESLCPEWLELSNLTISVLDAHLIHSVMYARAQNFVRANADGVVFVLGDKDDDVVWEDGLHFLSVFVLQVKETEDTPLLVLVNQADQDGARTLDEIDAQIRELLVKKGRVNQCYTIMTFNAKTGVGLERALTWLSDRLREDAIPAIVDKGAAHIQLAPY